MNILVAAMTAAGLALLAAQPRHHGFGLLIAGAGVALWIALWEGGIFLVQRALPDLPALGEAQVLGLNLGLTLAAGLLSTGILAWAAAWRARTRRPCIPRVLMAPAWALPVLFPDLGQGATDVSTTLAMAVAVAVVSLLIGYFAARLSWPGETSAGMC